MARTIAANMQTSIAARGAFLGHLYSFDFSGGTERFTGQQRDPMATPAQLAAYP